MLPGRVPLERAVYALYAPTPFVPARVRELVKHLVRGFKRRADAAIPPAIVATPKAKRPASPRR